MRKWTSHKFVGRVEKFFKNLPKLLKWRLFSENDLFWVTDFCAGMQGVMLKTGKHKAEGTNFKRLQKLYVIDHILRSKHGC